jgi:hypothetical protein
MKKLKFLVVNFATTQNLILSETENIVSQIAIAPQGVGTKDPDLVRSGSPTYISANIHFYDEAM